MNLIIWGTQCTVDYKYSMDADALRELLERFEKKDILQGCHEIFERIIETGLLKDEEPTKEVKIEGGELVKAIEETEKLGRYSVKSVEIGGSPAISAIYGSYLKNEVEELPEVCFCGMKPSSVKKFLSDLKKQAENLKEQSKPEEALQLEDKAKRLGEVFQYSVETEKKPATLGLEVGKHKLMLSNKEGRLLVELMSKENEEKDFERDLNCLSEAIRTYNNDPGQLMVKLKTLIENYGESLKQEIKNFVEILKGRTKELAENLAKDNSVLENIIGQRENLDEVDKLLRTLYKGQTDFSESVGMLEKEISNYEGRIDFGEYIDKFRQIIDEKLGIGRKQGIGKKSEGSGQESQKNSCGGEKAVSDEAEKAVVIALGGLNKGTPGGYGKLVESVKELKREYQERGIKVKLFIGTNSFGNDPKKIREYWEVIRQADIVSFNDAELESVYNALCGGDANIPLGEKLRILGSRKRFETGEKGFGKGLMVCHAAEGAIIKPVGSMERVIGKQAARNLSHFLKTSLQSAVDGTTGVYEGESYPNDTTIRNYSENIAGNSRQESPFFVKFVHPQSEFANGLTRAVAANVGYPVGNLVGLGAVFDGMLLSYLFSDNTERKG